MQTSRRTDGDVPGMAAAADDGSAADDPLFPQRPPIRSHRMPRSRRRARLAAIVLTLAVAALASRALPGANASRPSRSQDLSAAPISDPTTRQALTNDQSGSPAPLVASIGSPPSAPRSGGLPGPANAAASGTRPAASTPTTGPAPSPSTAGPPVSTVVAPADGLAVWVVNRASGQHFGVAADSTSDGALIVQSTSTGSAQQWRLVATSGNCYQLTNVHSGAALDNPGGSGTNGTQMQQWTLGVGNANQIWCFQSVGSGYYSIRNSASGSLLDLQDGLSGNGVAIREWGADPAAPNANQTWQLIRAG